MWYFIWILGIFLACSLSIITALTIENIENLKLKKKNHFHEMKESKKKK